MFVNHSFDAEMFVHRDRLLADAAEFRLARLARAARRRRRRDAAAREPTPSARNLTAPGGGRDDSEVARGSSHPADAENTGEKRRSPVRA
ncbi:MAG: hypothetical protein ABS81_23445 [Pseudonocardia sp. SCN 72-86]|nr:MAG: hypothetical protein ABS81_23445 [Pseudonocardia sp. SCN 72-86]